MALTHVVCRTTDGIDLRLVEGLQLAGGIDTAVGPVAALVAPQQIIEAYCVGMGLPGDRVPPASAPGIDDHHAARAILAGAVAPGMGDVSAQWIEHGDAGLALAIEAHPHALPDTRLPGLPVHGPGYASYVIRMT